MSTRHFYLDNNLGAGDCFIYVILDNLDRLGVKAHENDAKGISARARQNLYRQYLLTTLQNSNNYLLQKFRASFDDETWKDRLRILGTAACFLPSDFALVIAAIYKRDVYVFDDDDGQKTWQKYRVRQTDIPQDLVSTQSFFLYFKGRHYQHLIPKQSYYVSLKGTVPKNLDNELRAIETRVPSACLLGSGQQDAREAFLKYFENSLLLRAFIIEDTLRLSCDSDITKRDKDYFIKGKVATALKQELQSFLPLPIKPTLNASLETLKDDEQVKNTKFCDGPTKLRHLYKFNDYVCFQLNVFDFFNNRKYKIANKFLATEIELQHVGLGNKKYQLQSIVMHTGDTMDSGHYIALLRRKNAYYKVDDNDLQLQSSTSVSGFTPYLLFYKVIDLPLNDARPRGLSNPGTSCYANSVVQCLRDNVELFSNPESDDESDDESQNTTVGPSSASDSASDSAFGSASDSASDSAFGSASGSDSDEDVSKLRVVDSDSDEDVSKLRVVDSDSDSEAERPAKRQRLDLNALIASLDDLDKTLSNFKLMLEKLLLLKPRYGMTPFGRAVLKVVNTFPEKFQEDKEVQRLVNKLLIEFREPDVSTETMELLRI